MAGYKYHRPWGGAQPSSARCDRMPGVFERRSAGRVEQQVDARTRWQRDERQLDAGRYHRGRRRESQRIDDSDRWNGLLSTSPAGQLGAGAPMAKGIFAPAKGGSCMPPFLLSHWRGHQWAAAVASWIWVISRMDLGASAGDCCGDGGSAVVVGCARGTALSPGRSLAQSAGGCDPLGRLQVKASLPLPPARRRASAAGDGRRDGR